MRFSFFIIADTDRYNHFHIEATSMADWRLRFSAMKSHFVKKFPQIPFQVHTDIRLCNDTEDASYINVMKTNYTFYLLEKRHFDTVEEAHIYRENLIQSRLHKCFLRKSDTSHEKVTLKFVN